MLELVQESHLVSETRFRGPQCSSGRLASVLEALGSIPSAAGKQKKREVFNAYKREVVCSSL